jgi:L-galactose dehydrogenase
MTYCHYDLLNTSFDDLLLPTVKELGIGVINASVTHMGVLTRRGAPAWHPAPPEIHEVGRKVCDLVAARGSDITAVALQFALAHRDIASTCVSMASPEEVRENLIALDQPADSELLREIELLVASIRQVNWSQGDGEHDDPDSVPSRS